jgi:mRNA-degrading endonuclease toxin of MazEF toxin-antitoxin module
MPNYLRNDVVLVAYPFSDRTGSKVRPAVIVSGPHRPRDLFVVPLTSRVDRLVEGEFSLAEWKNAGLNMASVANADSSRSMSHSSSSGSGRLARWTRVKSTSRFEHGFTCDYQRR